jgi:hypothetical protein
MPQADITNASYLMGDPVYGDIYGDPDDDDYVGSPYSGDPTSDALNTYNTLIGDADDDFEETGAPRRRRSFVRRALPWAAGGLAATGLTIAAVRAIRKKQARKRAINNNLAQNARLATIQNQINARQSMGKIPIDATFPFYQVSGATLNSYPLAPTEVFAANTLKYNFDRQSTDTPFEVEIVPGVFAGVTWTLTATGTVATRFYTAVILTVGLSALTGAPGTIYSITGTFPTINGSLVVAANPWSFTLQQGYSAVFIVFPWQLVTNKPLLALGAYSNALPITVAVTGLPSTAAVNLIVPGSQHPWTIGMRNRLLS